MTDLVPSQPASTPPVAPWTPPPEVQDLLREQPRLEPVARFLLEGGQARHRRSLPMLARLRRLKPDANARAENPTRTAAFFDLDGTSLQGSIIQHLTSQAFAEGHGQVHHVVKFAACWMLYKLNLIPRVTMYRWGYAPCVGQDLGMVQEFVDRCLQDRIKGRVFQEARDAVAAHTAAGHLCVAITGAPDYAASEIAAHLGMHDVLATHTPLSDDGHITDEVQEPVCYGDGKLAFLNAYAAANSIDLSRSYFYSDSASDIPVLRTVGRPRVVNSQWLLLPMALAQRWPRATWRRLDRGGLPVTGASRALAGSPGLLSS